MKVTKITNNMKGFSLIEILIAVVIIGILSAIAIPAYRDYINKAKVTEVFPTFEGLKNDLAKEFFKTDVFPATYTIALTGNLLAQNYERPSNTRARLGVQIDLGETTNPWVSYVVKVCDGSIVTFCGSGGQALDIDQKYLSGSCQEDTDSVSIWTDTCS